MKKIILGLFITISLIKANNCLSKNERNQLGITRIPSDFQYVPNYIKCNKHKNKLEEFVCQDKDYLLMFHYLSEANIDFWERNYKKELNHKTWNNKSMKQWEKKYNGQNLNYNKLCFDLKKETTDLKGDESPYKMIELFNKIFFFQKNKYGAVLRSRNGYKIYLGKSCDVLDSKMQHGYWHKEHKKYFIELGTKDINFFVQKINLENYNCNVQKISILKLEKIIEKFPKRTVAYYNLGDVYWALGRKKEAKKMYVTYVKQMTAKGEVKRIPQVVKQRIGK